MKIEVKGMMCPHCEKHVTETILKIEGVTEVTASHEENCVTITADKEIPDAELKAAVEAAGYEYCGIMA